VVALLEIGVEKSIIYLAVISGKTANIAVIITNIMVIVLLDSDFILLRN
jgi:hypothetical protein